MLANLSVERSLMKAKSHAKKGEVAEAQKLYQTILQKFSNNIRAQQGLAALKKPQHNNIIQSPPQEAVDQLVNLYNQGEFSAVVEQAEILTGQYSGAFIVWNILGVSAAQIGMLDKAIEAYKNTLLFNPNYADAYFNMGIAFKEQGKLAETIEAYKKALALKPDYAKVYYNLGLALKDQGKLDDAIEVYEKAISIKPDYADAYNNMGVAFKEKGKLTEAIQAYYKSLSIMPDYAGVYYNLGLALKDQGKLEKAIEVYKKAISLKPDYADAYNNLGNIFQDQEKFQKSIEAFKKALSLKSDYAEAYSNIGLSLKGIAFKKQNLDLQKIIMSLLDKKTYVRPQDINYAAISLLKFEPNLKKHLEPQNIADVGLKPLEVIADLSELPLLLKLMSVCPIMDAGLEKLLIKLRAKLLMSITDLTNSRDILKFQSALALQCFTNEYIYCESEDEEKALALLEESVKQVLSNKRKPSSQTILCLASYKPLNHYEWSSSLLVTNEIKDVFTRQIIEPNKEANLKNFLPLLEDINDKVSLKVREQYESSPYPRWVNLRLELKPASISKVISEIKLKIFDDNIIKVKAPDILIAGCGTGQHSIETAARYKDSKVLAIDLSISSLSYAKRKTEELSIENIDYLQADILDLGKLDRQFDIVESVGVLHHMDKPVAGWRILKDCLKPGGLMKIGLYSELARQNILEMRKEISNAGLVSSDADMKSFRSMLMKSDKNHHKLILNSPDFYSLSTLKDLLFHVQEHRFTIAQIQECLSELELKFCGFEKNTIVSHFRLTNAGEGDLYNLDKWEAYEKTNPSTFAGMYQFWCQKPE